MRYSAEVWEDWRSHNRAGAVPARQTIELLYENLMDGGG
jgi:hypothetical protein